MGTVLASVAQREVFEGSVHDPDSFVRVPTAEQNEPSVGIRGCIILLSAD